MRTTAPRRRRPKTLSERSQADTSALPKAVLRTFDVLDIVPEQGPGLSMSEVCDRIALPQPSVFRLLAALHARGYLEQDAEGRYRLAPKVRLGRMCERSEWVKSVAHQQLQNLVGRFEETASLAFLFGDCVRVIDTVESLHDVRLANRLGRVLPPHASSLAKAITAFQCPDDVAQIIEVYGLYRRTEKTKLDRQLIYAEYGEIRSCGYSADRGEAVEGAVCLGAPIFFPSGKVEASISIATPEARFSAEREQQMVPALLQAAREITNKMKSGPPSPRVQDENIL